MTEQEAMAAIAQAKKESARRLELRDIVLTAAIEEALADWEELEKLTLRGENTTALPARPPQQLRVIDCSYTQVEDLAPLANLTQLQILRCHNTQVADLAPVANLIQLQSLDCSSTLVADLAPVAKLTQLQTLDCSYTQVTGLAPVANLTQLQSFKCSETLVADLAPVAKLTQLQLLKCSETLVADLAPVALLTQLQSLDCSFTLVADLTPVAKLFRLLILNCSNTQVQDLAPVENLTQLQILYCYETQVADLAPVKAMIEEGFEVKWQDWGFESGTYVKDCPLTNPPIEIVRKGNEAILDYLNKPGLLDYNADIEGDSLFQLVAFINSDKPINAQSIKPYNDSIEKLFFATSTTDRDSYSGRIQRVFEEVGYISSQPDWMDFQDDLPPDGSTKYPPPRFIPKNRIGRGNVAVAEIEETDPPKVTLIQSLRGALRQTNSSPFAYQENGKWIIPTTIWVGSNNSTVSLTEMNDLQNSLADLMKFFLKNFYPKLEIAQQTSPPRQGSFIGEIQLVTGFFQEFEPTLSSIQILANFLLTLILWARKSNISPKSPTTNSLNEGIPNPDQIGSAIGLYLALKASKIALSADGAVRLYFGKRTQVQPIEILPSDFENLERVGNALGTNFYPRLDVDVVYLKMIQTPDEGEFWFDHRTIIAKNCDISISLKSIKSKTPLIADLDQVLKRDKETNLFFEKKWSIRNIKFKK